MANELLASHVPLLVRVFTLSEGDVLELGTGYFSSLILKWMSTLSHRKVFAYENRQYWDKKAKEKQTEFYKVKLINSYNDAPIERKWGMAFVDHGPNSRRVVEIKRLADYADYIVIHDTNPEWDDIYHYSKIWKLFKYRYDYKLYHPHTSVVSNFKDLSNI